MEIKSNNKKHQTHRKNTDFRSSHFLRFLCFYVFSVFFYASSIFVLFVVPESPFAQPRNVIAAHCLTTFIGLGFYHWISPDWWSMAIALTVAITLIQFFRVPHPPAGSNPVIIFLSAPGWEFLLMPALTGAVILVAVAAVYNNLSSHRSYPKYW